MQFYNKYRSVIRLCGGIVFTFVLIIAMLCFPKISHIISRYLDTGLDVIFYQLNYLPSWLGILLLVIFIILLIAYLIFCAIVMATAQSGTRVTTLMKSLRQIFKRK